MEIEIQTKIYASAKDLAKSMEPEEIADFLSLIAERFDEDFVQRNNLSADFSMGLSEIGCRFLAECVTSYFLRNCR